MSSKNWEVEVAGGKNTQFHCDSLLLYVFFKLYLKINLELLLWFLIFHMKVNVKTSFLESNVCEHKSKSRRTQEIQITQPTRMLEGDVFCLRAACFLMGKQVSILILYLTLLNSFISSNSFLRFSICNMSSATEFFCFLPNLDTFYSFFLSDGCGQDFQESTFEFNILGKKGEVNCITLYLYGPVFSP